MSKECTKCGAEKLLEEFNKKGKRMREARCKACLKDVRKAAKCTHGRLKCRCVECGGKKRARCPHGKQESRCVKCGGKEPKCPCGEASSRTHCRKCSPESFLDGGVGTSICHLNRYGMVPRQYYDLRRLQNNACPICDKPLVSGDIHIDHLHGTDIVRGLLHPNCNINVLGRYYEDIGRTDNPKFEEYIQRNPLGRNPSNDPPLVSNNGS